MLEVQGTRANMRGIGQTEELKGGTTLVVVYMGEPAQFNKNKKNITKIARGTSTI